MDAFVQRVGFLILKPAQIMCVVEQIAEGLFPFTGDLLMLSNYFICALDLLCKMSNSCCWITVKLLEQQKLEL